MYGNQLNGFVKGGIRLSFSKNPLGVRPSASTANSGRRDGGRDWNGPSHQQQHQQHQQQQSSVNYSSIHDAFQSRPTQSHQHQGLSLDIGSGRPIRYEPNDMGSPNPAYNYSISPPPSRFFSPPPSSSQSSFGAMGPSSSAFPRVTTQGSLNHPSTGFGPVQHSPPYSAEGDERMRFRDPPHGFVPSPGLETTRVG